MQFFYIFTLLFLCGLCQSTLLPKTKLACYRKDCSEIWYQTYNLTYDNNLKLHNVSTYYNHSALAHLVTSSKYYYDQLDKSITNFQKVSTADLEEIKKTTKETKEMLGSLTFSPNLLAPVDLRPQFEYEYEQIFVTEGDSLSLLCQAKGKNVSYELYYGTNEKILSNSKITVTKSTSFISLLIYPCFQNDVPSSTILCQASNSHGLSTKVYDVVFSRLYRDETTSTTKAPAVKNVEENWEKYILATLILVAINTFFTLGPMFLPFLKRGNGI